MPPQISPRSPPDLPHTSERQGGRCEDRRAEVHLRPCGVILLVLTCRDMSRTRPRQATSHVRRCGRHTCARSKAPRAVAPAAAAAANAAAANAANAANAAAANAPGSGSRPPQMDCLRRPVPPPLRAPPRHRSVRVLAGPPGRRGRELTNRGPGRRGGVGQPRRLGRASPRAAPAPSVPATAPSVTIAPSQRGGSGWRGGTARRGHAGWRGGRGKRGCR